MIEVKNLTKRYKGSSKLAVDDVSLTAESGKITVLLGPNGAGKSTTIKSIVNLLGYKGEILICGHPNTSVEAKKSFGYIPEVPMLYDLLTVDETIEFIGKAYRLPDYKKTGAYGGPGPCQHRRGTEAVCGAEKPGNLYSYQHPHH